jgi:hypothetical protein
MELVAGCIKNKVLVIIPTNKKVATLYNYCTGGELQGHCAGVDAESTYRVMMNPKFE